MEDSAISCEALHLIQGYIQADNEYREAQFVAVGQSLARALYQPHSAVSSPGLLAVLDCCIDKRPTLALLKLEREEGAQVQLKGNEGNQSFHMSILDNLVLTEGTKLFKSALSVVRDGSRYDIQR